jgi:hypothetical protein
MVRVDMVCHVIQRDALAALALTALMLAAICL